jgi:hypothetical protein
MRFGITDPHIWGSHLPGSLMWQLDFVHVYTQVLNRCTHRLPSAPPGNCVIFRYWLSVIASGEAAGQVNAILLAGPGLPAAIVESRLAVHSTLPPRELMTIGGQATLNRQPESSNSRPDPMPASTAYWAWVVSSGEPEWLFDCDIQERMMDNLKKRMLPSAAITSSLGSKGSRTER